MNPKIRKLFIIALSLNILFVAGYAFVFIQVKHKTEQSALSIQALEESVSTEKNLQFLKGLIKETEDEREKIKSYFVDNEGVVGFIEEIERLGNIADIFLELKAVGIEGDAGDRALRLTLHTSGTFQNTYYFLTLVEHMPHKLEFTGAGMARLPQSGVWEGNFEMSVLSFSKK